MKTLIKKRKYKAFIRWSYGLRCEGENQAIRVKIKIDSCLIKDEVLDKTWTPKKINPIGELTMNNSLLIIEPKYVEFLGNDKVNIIY